MTHRSIWKVKLVDRAEQWRFLRFLVVGGYNTLFGFACFAALYYWFGESVHYLVLAAVSNVLSITNAFLAYRYLVFQSNGPFFTEYARIYVVYGGTAILGIALLAAFVELLGQHPVIAQGAVIAINAVVSYVSHSRFTFRDP